MNINVYLEDTLGLSLSQKAKKLGKSRNAIIREALKEWIAHHDVKKWPNSIFTFVGMSDTSSFESNRSELLSPKEDPFE